VARAGLDLLDAWSDGNATPYYRFTSRRSTGRDLGRNSAVPLAVSEPFLSRFSTQMDENFGF
jgi:hypothetical protein